MKFAEVQKAARTDGMGTALLRLLHSSTLLNLDQIGALAGRLGNTAHMNGLTYYTDNQLISANCIGSIVVDWYERPMRQLFHKYVPKDEPVIELGASIGVVACEVNHCLHFPEKHAVVEASPQLVPTLKKNRDSNQCRFEIVEAALAYDSPSIPFFTNNGCLGGSVYPGEGEILHVPTQTLAEIAERSGFTRFNLICDIEGSEMDMVERELDFMRQHVGVFLVEVHYDTARGEDAVITMLETLMANGFEKVERIFTNYCFRNTNS